MARRKNLTEFEKEQIIAEWKAGRSQRWIAGEHNISVGSVNKLCKEIPQDNIAIVNANVFVKQELATRSEQEVNAVHNLVDEKTKHIQFFNNAAVANIQQMMSKVGEETKIVEHKMASEAIAKAKETVCGKSPETAIQINNEPAPITKITRVIVDPINDTVEEY